MLHRSIGVMRRPGEWDLAAYGTDRTSPGKRATMGGTRRGSVSSSTNAKGTQCAGTPIRVNALCTGHAAAGADDDNLAGRARHVGISRRGRALLKAGRSARSY
jgi:hypothetical protein